MRQVGSASFRFSEPEQIDHTDVLEELKSTSGSNPHKSGCETWTCAWSPDYSYFAWSSGNRIVQLLPWDRTKRSTKQSTSGHILCQKHIIDCGELVWSVAFGSGRSRTEGTGNIWTWFRFDGMLTLATGLQSGKIKLWDCSTGGLLMELLDHKDVVKDLSFAPDGSLHLLSAARDGTLKLWDLNLDGNMYKTLRPQCKWMNGCRWSPNRKFIAGVGNFKCVVLWKITETGNHEVHKLNGHYNDVISCDFSPDGALLATASFDTRVIIWDPYTGDAILELGHLFPPPRPIYAGGANDHYVRDVSFSSDGIHVASIADDGYIRFWNLWDEGDPVAISENSNALCCSFSPDGSILAVGSRNGSIQFFSSPRSVQTLQHQCRMTIRRLLSPSKVDHLYLPIRMKEFLKYRDIH